MQEVQLAVNLVYLFLKLLFLFLVLEKCGPLCCVLLFDCYLELSDLLFHLEDDVLRVDDLDGELLVVV